MEHRRNAIISAQRKRPKKKVEILNNKFRFMNCNLERFLYLYTQIAQRCRIDPK